MDSRRGVRSRKQAAARRARRLSFKFETVSADTVETLDKTLNSTSRRVNDVTTTVHPRDARIARVGEGKSRRTDSALGSREFFE